ncbi:cytochrome c [Candidatus Pelagibacter sp.]|nr:cytochrome c [Candidatus Pelagibacter sp.]
MIKKNNFLIIIIFFFLNNCDSPNDNDAKMLTGSKIFSEKCISCHQKGMVVNNSQKLKLNEIVFLVTHGAGNGMPSFKNILNKKEIDAVSYFYKYKKQ